MMSLATRIAPVLSLVVLSWISARTASAEQSTEEQNRQLSETIHRYFAANSGYREGYLICRSQVEELQRYLRRSRGNIPAVRRILLNRVLKDEAPLTQFFYSKRGETVLCAAAIKLAGYTELETAARTAAGRKQIKAAIQSDQSDALVEYVKQAFSKKPTPDGQKAGQQRARAAIYTLDQFVEAALATPS